MRGDATKGKLKLTARRLFALHGVDGVTVRQIVEATGQKNGGSLHYYFRSKDALVRELIADTAKLIDDRRNETLDAMEARGGPRDLREALGVLVWPSTNLGEADGEEDTYLRFISLLALQQRQLLNDVLGDDLNSGYQRCLAYIRKLATDIPQDVLERRLVFLSISLRAVMAAREAALDHRKEHMRFWTAPGTMDHLLDVLEGVIRAPISFIDASRPRARARTPRSARADA